MQSDVRKLSSTVLRRTAALVDMEQRFPHASVDGLRELGLLGYFIPHRLGGCGGTMREFCQIAAILGEECMSTAMIWVMHAHQVAVVVDHGDKYHDEYLRDIAINGKLLASVTSEYGKGGDVLRSDAPLVPAGNGYRLQREAPTVSYGKEADYFLITMRAGPDRPHNDSRLVMIPADSKTCLVKGDWQSMGLRGTRSIPMSFELDITAEQVLGNSFRRAVIMTMVPAAHIGWSSAWYGAANGAVKKFTLDLRQSKSKHLKSEAFLKRLAASRVNLDLVKSILQTVADEFDVLRASHASFQQYQDITFNLAINNVKIAASKLCFDAVNELIELAGMNKGYLNNNPLGLERAFRDLRSASLMYSNDRLYNTNGRLTLFESSGKNNLWQE